MKELDIINDMLSTLGELPLNEMDEEHPFVPQCRSIIARQSETLQARGWWFNQELIVLTRDASSGFIYIPADASRCNPVNFRDIVQRGRRLYDTYRSTYAMSEASIECNLIRILPLDDLPPAALEVIRLRSMRAFQLAYDADKLKLDQVNTDLADAWVTLRAENTRNVKANLIYRGSTAEALNQIRWTGPLRRLPTFGQRRTR